jgi:chromosome segregation protein
MHISKLELFGFKSFPDRTGLHFGPGVSAVVGPNGCGKSNIVDAVKWCLGEQSAKSLRGAAMQDIIFAGSEERSPLGMGEVTITLAAGDEPFVGDWAPYDELQVTRRLHRDGQSEYLINHNKVRMRDIQELFLDSGAGNKMYSFIEQGRIGQIVNARPEDRRSLIEEAAGISRYKARREEAEQKLGQTAENLDRVNTVVDDLSSRMKTLEKQVGKAMRHRRLRSFIRQGEIVVGLAQHAALTADRKILVEKVRAAEAEEIRLISAVDAREVEISQERQGVDEAEAAVGRLRDRLGEVEANRREQESARQYQKKERGELVARAQTVSERGRQAALTRATSEKRLTDVVDERNKLERGLIAAEEELGRRRAEVNQLETVVRDRRARIDEGKNLVMAKVREALRLKAELDSGAARMGDLEGRLKRVHLRKSESGGALADVTRRLTNVSARVVDAEKSLTACKEVSAGLVDTLAAREAELRKAVFALSEAERNAHAAERAEAQLRARHDSLAAMVDGHADLDEDLRRVLRIPGVRGVLADQLTVSPELEAALSVALGPALQSVLVDDADVAARVATEAKGRVGVLLNGPPGEAPLGLGGSPAAISALSRLLGPVDRAPNVVAAVEAWRQNGRAQLIEGARPAFLSDRGELFAGESRSPGLAILARRREVAALRVELDARIEAHQAARVVFDEARAAREKAVVALAEVKGTAEAARQDLAEAELTLREASRHKADLEREKAHQESQARLVAQEETELGATIAVLRSRLDEARRGLIEAQEQQANAESALAGDQARVADEARDLGRYRELLGQRSQEAAALRERARGLERAAVEIQAALEGANKAVLSSEEEGRQIGARVDEIDLDDIRIGTLLDQLSAETTALRASIEEERERVKKAREGFRKHEEGLKALRTQREAATGARMDLDRQVVTVREEIARGQAQLEERHSVSAPALLDKIDRVGHLVLEPDPDITGEGLPNAAVAGDKDKELLGEVRVTAALLSDMAYVKRMVERVGAARGELSRMGEVNLVALQEYTELGARFAEVDKQRADLQDSVKSIRQSIARLNRICRERFRETFDRVDQSFREIYPRLVGGGKARLQLTDEEDVLVSGVEIFVQPPGKKLQSLSLLSGGETAMVAISLLFSLFRVKPSPFCILDEVDAPLDEGNGARFNLMLREMAELSQFIVVTHNKKTMEGADTLYGITMPTPGVSRLVTVQVDG